MIDLEWDEAKRRANLGKRGLDFADAFEFDWEGAITIPDARHDYGERRFMALGELQGRVHSVVYVRRKGRRRLISFRKANTREIQRYEAEKIRS